MAASRSERAASRQRIVCAVAAANAAGESGVVFTSSFVAVRATYRVGASVGCTRSGTPSMTARSRDAALARMTSSKGCCRGDVGCCPGCGDCPQLARTNTSIPAPLRSIGGSRAACPFARRKAVVHTRRIEHKRLKTIEIRWRRTGVRGTTDVNRSRRCLLRSSDDLHPRRHADARAPFQPHFQLRPPPLLRACRALEAGVCERGRARSGAVLLRAVRQRDLRTGAGERPTRSASVGHHPPTVGCGAGSGHRRAAVVK
jgi:hypothetical protein